MMNRNSNDARRFRCHHRLQLHQVDQPRLHKLRLRQGRDDAQQRLLGKEHGALRHRIDIAGEAKTFKIAEEISGEAARPAQPVEIGGGKPHGFDELDCLRQTCCHQEAAPRRQLAAEELEHGRFRHAVLQVRLHHVELVEVGQQGIGEQVHAVSRR